MSRGRAARAASEELATEIEESDLVKTAEEVTMSAADEAMLEGILAGHKTRMPAGTSFMWP